jgi:hypothetical protein
VTPPARGSFLAYAAAFALLVGAGVALTVSATDFLGNIATLRVSIGLSVLAIVAAVVSLVVPRRR